MGDKHSHSFFGKKVGLIINTSSKNEPYMFFTVIKKKGNDIWEKPSNKEGKTIKFSLEEMVKIIQVLEKELPSWSSFHSFKDKKTQISFKWGEKDGGKLWIRIGDYPKMLNYAQIKILEMLLKHVLKEKIKHATSGNFQQKNVIPVEVEGYGADNLKVVEEREPKTSNDALEIEGMITNSTPKALLIKTIDEKETWFPRSTIKSNYDEKEKKGQSLLVESWILKKNKIEI